MNRYEFLTLLGAGIAAQPFTAVARLLTSTRSISLNQLKRSHFEQQKNTHFTVVSEKGEKVLLKLVEVDDGFVSPKKLVPSQRENRFSLLFEIEPGALLEQNSYRFMHPEIGQFDLFITPTRWKRSMNYREAVIYRI